MAEAANERKWFKGTAALELDRWYSRGDIEANLRLNREVLEGNMSFREIVEALAGDGKWNADEFAYPLSGGALQGAEFESVMRHGYLEAISLALAHTPPVPIKTFWMTGVSNPRFELHISDDADQVVVTLLVPDTPGGTDREGSPESWVITTNEKNDIEVTQTSGSPGDLQRPSARAAAR